MTIPSTTRSPFFHLFINPHHRSGTSFSLGTSLTGGAKPLTAPALSSCPVHTKPSVTRRQCRARAAACREDLAVTLARPACRGNHGSHIIRRPRDGGGERVAVEDSRQGDHQVHRQWFAHKEVVRIRQVHRHGFSHGRKCGM